MSPLHYKIGLRGGVYRPAASVSPWGEEQHAEHPCVLWLLYSCRVGADVGEEAGQVYAVAFQPFVVGSGVRLGVVLLGTIHIAKVLSAHALELTQGDFFYQHIL